MLQSVHEMLRIYAAGIFVVENFLRGVYVPWIYHVAGRVISGDLGLLLLCAGYTSHQLIERYYFPLFVDYTLQSSSS